MSIVQVSPKPGKSSGWWEERWSTGCPRCWRWKSPGFSRNLCHGFDRRCFQAARAVQCPRCSAGESLPRWCCCPTSQPGHLPRKAPRPRFGHKANYQEGAACQTCYQPQLGAIPPRLRPDCVEQDQGFILEIPPCCWQSRAGTPVSMTCGFFRPTQPSPSFQPATPCLA